MADPASYRPRPGEIPTSPGVYRFRDTHGRVIYVGKAKSLRGGTLIATPLMLTAGIGLAETVVVNLVVALITRVGVTVQLREHIDWRRVAVLGAASVPGAWLGVQTVTLLPDQHLKPTAGAVNIL